MTSWPGHCGRPSRTTFWCRTRRARAMGAGMSCCARRCMRSCCPASGSRCTRRLRERWRVIQGWRSVHTGLWSFEEANGHFEHAVELWAGVTADQRPEGLSLVELLARAAEAAYLSGENHRAVTLTRSALE